MFANHTLAHAHQVVNRQPRPGGKKIICLSTPKYTEYRSHLKILLLSTRKYLKKINEDPRNLVLNSCQCCDWELHKKRHPKYQELCKPEAPPLLTLEILGVSTEKTRKEQALSDYYIKRLKHAVNPLRL